MLEVFYSNGSESLESLPAAVLSVEHSRKRTERVLASTGDGFLSGRCYVHTRSWRESHQSMKSALTG